MSTKNNFSLDSNIYIAIRWFCFIIASAVSILLDIVFLQGLDTSSKPLLTCISFVLELAKLVAVMSMGIVGDLSEKVQSKKTKFHHGTFIAIYLAGALLSVIASLGFSTMITSRSAATTNLQLETLQAQVSQIEEQNSKLIDLNNLMRLPKSEYIEEYEIKYQNADASYRERDAEYAQALAERQRLGSRTDDNALDWDKFNANVNGALTLRNAADRARTEAQRNRATATSEYDQRKRDAEEDLTAQTAVMVLMLQNAKTESQLPQAAIMELKLKLSEMEAENVRSMGMQYVFVTWSEFLKTSQQAIKFTILIIISILLEITIFQSSPDIRVSRRVMFFFRHTLPKNTDVRELLEIYDKEYLQYTDITDRLETTYNAIEHKVEQEPIIEIPVETPAEQPKKKRKYTRRPKQIIETIEVESTENNKDVDTSDNIEKFVKEPVQEEPIIKEVNQDDNQYNIGPSEENQPDTRQQSVESTERNKQTSERIVENNDTFEEESDLARVQLKKSFTLEEKFEPSIELKKEQVFPYRFGQTTEAFKNRFIMFLSGLYEGQAKEYTGTLANPSSIAKKLGLSDKVKDVFLKRLLEMRFNGSPLVYIVANDIKSDFSKEFLIEYTTTLLEPSGDITVKEQTSSNINDSLS